MWKTTFQNFERVWHALGRPYSFNYFKGRFLQFLFGPFLYTLSQICCYESTQEVFNLLFNTELCINSYLWHSCRYAYQEVRNASFAENCAYVLNGWSLDIYWSFPRFVCEINHLHWVHEFSTLLYTGIFVTGALLGLFVKQNTCIGSCI